MAYALGVALLHVTNGDSTAGTLRQTALGGTVVAWRDALHEGQVPAGDDEGVRAARARFLATTGIAEGDVLAELRARDAMLLEALESDDDVVLWFEHDLYDQLQLVQALALVARADVSTNTLRLICIDRFEGHPGFAGLGELNPDELETLWPLRAPIATDTLGAAVAAWDAFREGDPREVAAHARGQHPGLPFLGAALTRLLEELPSARDGLARSERQLLEALAGGATSLADLLLASFEQEEAPFLGDTWLVERLDRLAGGPRPLVEDGWRLTHDGRATLDGRLDAVEAVQPDRWLGGVRVQGPRPWRWDADTRQVVAP